MKKNRLKKGIIITVSTLLILAAGSSFAFGGFIADRILHQNADKDTHDNSIKQMEVWEYDYKSFEDKYKGTEISTTADDGNVVPATYYSNDCDTCVILVHGAGGDRACTAPLAEGYLERGYDVIAIDQRGCGANPDDRVTFGINEQLDVRAMVKYARETLGKKTVYVHGQSMGAQTTAIYASNVTPGDVNAADAVICDSPVPGMELVLKEMFATCTIATFVLFLHKLFDNFSPLFMMVAQYLIASALIGGMLLLISKCVSPITPRGWFEFYRSFTIPYIFLAGFYYYRVFSETKKQDALIKEIQNLQE